MKKNLFKNFPTFIILLITIFGFYGCDKQQIDQEPEQKKMPDNKQVVVTNNFSSLSTKNLFTKTVGAPIDGELGRSWIKNFKKANPFATTSSYIIEVKDLQSILSNRTCVGICLYYAVDNKKQVHILPVGINENGRVIKNKSINTQAGLISWKMAQQWINNYSGKIHGHFFGSNIFETLFRNSFSKAIRTDFGMDEKNVLQLLLSGAEETNLSIYMDRSSPVPATCITCFN